MTSQQMIEELKNFDTPSITNVVATYPSHPLCLGLYNPWREHWYTNQSLRCMYPVSYTHLTLPTNREV